MTPDREANGVTNVLVIGNGAREHTLCWALTRSRRLGRLYCAPGNAGTALLATNLPVNADDVEAIVATAREHQVGLVVVGPEAPLAAGLADRLRAAGIPAFGPGQAAARIEASKAWAKDLMASAGIPTARSLAVTSLGAARAGLRQFGLPVVVKADGLAAGKGVTVAQTQAQAEAALDELFVLRTLGHAAETVVVEECLTGPELSVLALCDGERIARMPPARDYKRAEDGDRGPNTGGMGAYSRPANAPSPLLDRIERDILRPAVDALARRGAPFIGVLYAGLMLTPDGPKVLEFNCRFGDPETQVILPLLASDALDLFERVALGRLDPSSVSWSPGVACGVVMASEGYPGSYPSGRIIHGLDDLPAGSLVFQAGTRRAATGGVETAGGRVLTVVGQGADLAAARQAAYGAAARISFDGGWYRRDIGASDPAS
ncbi:MAG: phosphoribosylamine--glycine ligase [Chloroflexi bacterium]|nr:phosphoribosylamine--glycine ligase [Chloroflexota bacterium]